MNGRKEKERKASQAAIQRDVALSPRASTTPVDILNRCPSPAPAHLARPPLFNLAEAGDRREEVSEGGGGALLRLARGAAGFTGPSPLPVSVLAREEEASPASLMREVVAAPQRPAAGVLPAASLEV